MNTIIRSEVTIINKQKFLAELGRLLTFMYEEDRQLALDMYEKMFDGCPDIHALMQILVSPTRQAVVIARAYDATDRKLQVYSTSREEEGIEDDGELPGFVLAIDQVYQSAVDRGLMEEENAPAPVLENQISIFDDSDVPGLFEVEETEESEALPAAEELPMEAEELSAEESSQEEALPVDEVAAFLASFAIEDSELIPADCAENTAEEEEPAEAEEVQSIEEAEEEPVQTELEVELPAVEENKQPAQTVRKPKVFLMILYIIAAIPVTLAGLALLLIPTAVVLALAVSVILAGSAAFAAAFSGFAVFADLMVVLGTALIVSAVGLILLWLFIWFIGGAMAGFVKSVVHLGAKCCYKEVPAV